MPKLARGLCHFTEPGVHTMSQVPHSTQSSYVNCMRPLTNSKHLAGQALTHIVCGQVSQMAGSTVMCANSCASVTNFVEPSRALTSIFGNALSGDSGRSTVRGLVAVVGPPSGSAWLGALGVPGACVGAWLIVILLQVRP